MAKKYDLTDTTKWRGQDMKHLTFTKGEILVASDGTHYVEVLEVLEPWTPTGPTWQTKMLLVKIAAKNGSPMKKGQKPFENWCMGYNKLTDDTVNWHTKKYEEAVTKALKDMKAYEVFAKLMKDKIIPFASLRDW